jgi:Flp pilus assembly protein CpaB
MPRVSPGLALLISLAAGIAGALLLYLHVQRIEARIHGGPESAVLVLTSDLAAGAVIARDAIAARTRPAQFREGQHIAFDQIDHVIGAQVASALNAGEPLHWSDLKAMRPALRTLASVVPAGMRAMTLREQRSGLDGLLTPGDRVDALLGTAERGAEARDGAKVVEGLLVLAIGRELSMAGERPRDGAVTVSVTLEQAALLSAAEQNGGVRLVLRNAEDLVLAEPGAEHAPQAELKP